MSISGYLTEKTQQAMLDAGFPADCAPNISRSKRLDIADYQINGAMAVAKKVGTNPREVAAKIIEQLSLNETCESIEIAGPGFINLKLSNQWLASWLATKVDNDSLGVATTSKPEIIVVDYSSPNLAKEMHVGHLRGTILGDVIAKTLEFQGHKVVRQNHIGDWGTQFGMLIAELREQGEQQQEMQLHDLEKFYRQAKAHFDADPEFATTARKAVVELQSGDPETIKYWQRFIQISLEHASENYELLGVSLKPEHVMGESSYNPYLSDIVADLKTRGIAQTDQGAQVVFLEELADKNGKPSVYIVQKADGGYLYSTSDLAAVYYRVNELKANRSLYFVDSRQGLHFKQLFAAAKKAGWITEDTHFEHCAYGTIMGQDGRPFKTRSGDSVKLSDLLNEAIERAQKLLTSKSTDLTVNEAKKAARAVGIGAVKYADLSKTRSLDYVFDWDSMLSFEGNTAPYLLYAYTRICSILRRAEQTEVGVKQAVSVGFKIERTEERQLALALAQFSAVVSAVAEKTMPHELCGYLFDLSGKFMSFYENCPILKDDIPNETKQARLVLVGLCARVIKQSLDLLGLETVEKM